jgi:hypothetical protein
VPGARNTDLIFLKGLMDSPVMNSLVKVQDRLEGTNGDGMKPIDSEPGETTTLIQDVKRLCSKMSLKNRNAAELNLLLNNPHVGALAEAHDSVVHKAYDEPEFAEESYEMEVFGSENYESGDIPPNAIRMVGIRKSNDEPLGMTFFYYLSSKTLIYNSITNFLDKFYFS